MPSHIAWIYKEEIIQTTDSSEGRVLNWSFGKEYLTELNTAIPINITVIINQK
jgi:Zn-finger domain-containing protein